MRQHGFEPEFSAAIIREVGLLDTPSVRSLPGDVRDLRTLLWSSVDNRESRDLGQNSINRTVLGAPRIVPVGDALVHVQPVYVTAGGSGFPRLQLVTAFANGRVGHGPDVRSALRRAVR